MKKLLAIILLSASSICSAAFIPNNGPMTKLDVDGSTRTVGYQGAISSVPVSVQGTASVQVLTSTLQVQIGNTVPVTGTFFQATQPISGAVSGSGPYSVTAGTGMFTMGFVGATGSTVSASYQGATISSFPVSIQGLPTVQVIASTLQVQGIAQVVTSTLQVQGITQVVTSTLQVQGIAEVVTSTLQVQGIAQVVTSTLQVQGIAQVVTSTIQVNINGLPGITKGTQGATGITTQDLKDAGRTAIMFYVTSSTVGATGVESALTFTKSAGTGSTSSAYTFVITSGKRFRITYISIATQANASATTHSTVFNLRLNTAANCNAGSTPVLGSWRSASAAVAGQWDRMVIPIGEGYEIAGNGTIQLCASVNSTFVTNAPTADMTIIGYEY